MFSALTTLLLAPCFPVNLSGRKNPWPHKEQLPAASEQAGQNNFECTWLISSPLLPSFFVFGLGCISYWEDVHLSLYRCRPRHQKPSPSWSGVACTGTTEGSPVNARTGQARLAAVCPAMPQREHPMSSCSLSSTGVPAALHLHRGHVGLSLKTTFLQGEVVLGHGQDCGWCGPLPKQEQPRPRAPLPLHMFCRPCTYSGCLLGCRERLEGRPGILCMPDTA